MFSEAELQKAIEELENAPVSYRDAEKLATFYILYDHIHKRQNPGMEHAKEVKIDRYGGSEFFHVISGKKARDVWKIMNEVMSMLKVTDFNAYKAVMRRLTEL